MEIQKAGDNSQQYQIQQVTINQGIDEKRAREIYDEKYSIAKQDFTEEALRIANERVKELEDIINKCCEYGLKSPEFYQEEDFRVVIWRSDNEGSVPKRSKDDPTAFQSVPTDEEKLLEVIKETPSISRAELSRRLKISERQVRKITDLLREKGILIREGGNSGKWIINKI